MSKMLGVMLDCSRNAVMKIDKIKVFADIIKAMGYNTLLLYMEDTYEITSQPFFGHLRGRYSQKELREIDRYCAKIGIEVVPCIQTLAHLETMFKWTNEYDDINDCDNVLLIGEDKTYALIEDMIATVAHCFQTRKIHIGMDEAYRVGLGKYRQLHGIADRFDIINFHLHKVCEIVDKYGLQPMIWSDMFCRLALNVENQYEKTDTSVIRDKAQLPSRISLVYWDYYSTDYEHYIQMIKTNQLFDRKVYFAGGAWSWKGFAPDNDFSIRASDAALRACASCGVDDIILTTWGDDGAECSTFAMLPTMMYVAEVLKGNRDLESIKLKFKSIVGCEFDDFMLLDQLDTPGGHHDKSMIESASKYLLYNDLFMGIYDYRCVREDGIYYQELSEQIQNIKEHGNFSALFNSYEKLANVLAVKADLGIQTREAYLKQDKQKLYDIAKDYDIFLNRLQEFYDSYQKRWFEENKPHGFDVQDIRLGGLRQRAIACKNRLLQFLAGEIENIPELEEARLDKVNGIGMWARCVTANNIWQDS